MLTNEKTKRSSKLLLCAAALALSAFGCATDEAGTDTESTQADVDGLALEAPSSQATKPDPTGVYIKGVKANGTGCPKGSHDSSLSADGLALTITFNAYETSLEPGQAQSVKDCQISMTMRTPPGYMYAISEFSYSGYAFLEPGVTLRQTANYYFQGNPKKAERAGSSLTAGSQGYDSSFLLKDELPLEAFEWSPCGAERELNVATRIRLKNNAQKSASAYANITAVDANVRTEDAFNPYSKLVMKLAKKLCDEKNK